MELWVLRCHLHVVHVVKMMMMMMTCDVVSTNVSAVSTVLIPEGVYKRTCVYFNVCSAKLIADVESLLCWYCLWSPTSFMADDKVDDDEVRKRGGVVSLAVTRYLRLEYVLPSRRGKLHIVFLLLLCGQLLALSISRQLIFKLLYKYIIERDGQKNNSICFENFSSSYKYKNRISLCDDISTGARCWGKFRNPILPLELGCMCFSSLRGVSIGELWAVPPVYFYATQCTFRFIIFI